MVNSLDPLFNKKRQLNKRGKRASFAWRHKLTPKAYDLDTEWEEEAEEENAHPESQEPKKKGLGILWVFFGLAALFFVGSLLFVYFSFTQGKVGIRADAILVSADYPVSVASGELFKLDFTIQNTNQLPIEDLELVLEFPIGTSAADSVTEEVRRKRVELGDLNAGGFVQHTEQVRFFGENDQRILVKSVLEYQVPSSNAIFEIPKQIEVSLSSAPVRITVDALESLTAGQTVSFDISIESNAAETLENIMFIAEYPFGFSFVDSDLDPTLDDNIWRITKLEPDESIQFTVRGTLAGQNNEERRFLFNAGLESNEVENTIGLAFSSLDHFVRISKPFLEFDLLFSDEIADIYVRSSEEDLDGTIILRNTTSQPIRDAEVTLTFNEPIFDKFKVRPQNGFFDSQNATLKWNEQTLEDLSFIAPGEIKELSFTVGLLASIRDDGTINKNPELTLNATVRGERSSEQGADEEIKTNVLKKIILQTVPVLATTSRYNSEMFTNTGPTPPKVEQETTYEVSYDLRNSSSDIENGQMVTRLPQHARWKGVVVPSDESVSYNEITREITWDVGLLPAGVGYISAPRVVSIQIGVFPSSSQLGESPLLVENNEFVGYDTYTKTNVTAVGRAVSTQTVDSSAKSQVER